MLARDGRALLTRNLLLPPGILDANEDGWLTPDVPILVRGQLRIIPVAWFGAAERGYNASAEPRDIERFASDLLDAGMYSAGPWRAIDLTARSDDSLGSYASALRAAGATKADRFVYVQDGVGVVVVWAGDEQAGTRSLSLHVVPESWVFEPAAGEAVSNIDAVWNWSEVVDLAVAASGPAPA
ncbi:hypothetical protein GCM10009796_13190 [Microbacterium koreense]